MPRQRAKCQESVTGYAKGGHPPLQTPDKGGGPPFESPPNIVFKGGAREKKGIFVSGQAAVRECTRHCATTVSVVVNCRCLTHCDSCLCHKVQWPGVVIDSTTSLEQLHWWKHIAQLQNIRDFNKGLHRGGVFLRIRK
jgi:hypothetical protein